MKDEVRSSEFGVRSQVAHIGVRSSDELIYPAFGERTLASEISHSGVGLHSGISTDVRLLPAEPGQGRYFVRVDLPEQPMISARVEAVEATVLSTQLGKGLVCVRTVEHLLAALAAMGVDNARIEVNGPEVPILDGSAQVWAEAIAQVGLVAVGSGVSDHRVSLQEPIWVRQGDAFVAALPAPNTRFTYGIDFDLPAIGNQWHSWSPSAQGEFNPEPRTASCPPVRSTGGNPPTALAPPNSSTQQGATFITEIAPARTFGLIHQIDQLRDAGLIKGGSLDNALVCGPEGWLNPPLRFANEPARHKILDLVGDLSLLGTVPTAHFLAYKASHSLHIQLAQRILDLKF